MKENDMSKISLVGMLVLAGASLGSVGCPAVQTACQIIKAAADVCTVVEYTGTDGKTYRVKVTKEQIDGLAMEAAKRDGVPGPVAPAAAPAPAVVQAPAPVASAAPVPPPAPAVSAAPPAPVASAKPAASAAPAAPKAKK
jgi:hypothetical protein